MPPSRTAIAVCVLMAGAAYLVPLGRAKLNVRDVTKKVETVVRAPWQPFRKGVLAVTVDGRLTGQARVHIYSNQGRDHAIIHLRSGGVREYFLSKTKWVDDVRIAYEPLDARDGELTIATREAREARR